MPKATASYRTELRYQHDNLCSNYDPSQPLHSPPICKECETVRRTRLRTNKDIISWIDKTMMRNERRILGYDKITRKEIEFLQGANWALNSIEIHMKSLEQDQEAVCRLVKEDLDRIKEKYYKKRWWQWW